MNPLLSVIVPHQNEGKFLKNTLQAIFNQSFQNFEVLVVDNSSSDDHLEAIYHLAAQNQRLRLLRSDGSLNSGLKEARGQFCLFICPHSWLLPTFFADSVEVLLNHPEVALCVSDNGFFYDGQEIVHTEKLHPAITKTTVFNSTQSIELFKKSSFWIPSHSTVIRKKALHHFGGFSDHLGLLSDWFLMHASALKFGLAYLPATLSAKKKNENKKNPKKEVEALLSLLANERELRSLFCDSNLLKQHAKAVLPKIIFNPRNWDLLI